MRNPTPLLTASVVLPPLVGGGLALLAIYGTGIYGLALFFAVPFLLGWMATSMLRVAIGPQRLRRCLEVSGASALVLGALFLVFKAEGALCLLMALPIAVPFILLGTWAAWRAFHRRDLPPLSSTAALVLFAIVGIAIEPRFQRSVPPIVVSGVHVTATFVIASAFESAVPMPPETAHVDPAGWAVIVTS